MFNLASENGKSSLRLGTQESAKWNVEPNTDGALSISYTSLNKTTIVELLCSNDGTSSFKALDDTSMNIYKFRLTHKCACWNGCEGKEIVTVKKLIIISLS